MAGSGLFDLVEEIKAMAGKRRVVACAANMAASAAYAIACAADEVYVSRSGMVGSIGVIRLHMSYAEALSQAGIEPTIIHAGSHKPNGTPYQALSHLARSEYADEIDRAYGVFCDHVAATRKIDCAAVKATEARVFYGEAGVTAKLADGVATVEEALAKIRKSPSRPSPARPAKTQPQKTAAGTTPPASTTPPQKGTLMPDDQSAMTAAITDALQALVSRPASASAAPPPVAAAAPAAANDAERVLAIVGSPEGKAHPDTAIQLARAGMSADAAIAVLKTLPAAVTTPAPEAVTTPADALAREMNNPRNSGGIRPEAGRADGTDAAAHRPPLSQVFSSRFSAGRRPKRKN